MHIDPNDESGEGGKKQRIRESERESCGKSRKSHIFLLCNNIMVSVQPTGTDILSYDVFYSGFA